MPASRLPLRDGDQVAVIGAGPAGALFAHFFVRYARATGLRVGVTLFDGRLAEGESGGCSLSAGVLAQDFLAALEATGLTLPLDAVQRELAGYVVETPHGSVRLAPPAGERQAVAVYRGATLRDTVDRDGVANFDQRLLAQVAGPELALVPNYVRAVRLGDSPADQVRLTWYSAGSGQTAAFALVVVASGLNSGLPAQLARLAFGYREPRWSPSVQADLAVAQEDVAQRLRGAVGVYFLNLPGIHFAAITPRRHYATVTLVGERAAEPMLEEFLHHPVPRRRLAGEGVSPRVLRHSRPRALEEPAAQPYTDRLVFVGDAAVSRLYKNGLYSALVTARRAAAAAIYQGVGCHDFARVYAPVCAAIARDNRIGRFLLRLYEYPLQHHPALATRLLRALATEQQVGTGRQPGSTLLWHLLTGDRPYGELRRRLLDPRLYSGVLHRGEWPLT